MTIFEIEAALKSGRRVTLLMRHAERPPLDPGDTTFGATLPITERGRQTARRFGMMLSHIVSPEQVRACASSTLRTVQTALCILEGLHSGDDAADDGRARPPGAPLAFPVDIAPFLGSDSPFFGSLDERMALIAEGHYRERLNEYYSVGEQKGYQPLAGATDRMEESLSSLTLPSHGLLLAVTHDVNVGCFLAGRKVVTSFTADTWPYYLDAAVILSSPKGAAEYGLLRWDSSFDGLDA